MIRFKISVEDRDGDGRLVSTLFRLQCSASRGFLRAAGALLSVAWTMLVLVF